MSTNHDDAAIARSHLRARSGGPASVLCRGRVVWLFGLSGSGKSTLADILGGGLRRNGHAVKMLDGDVLRMGLNRNLGFSDVDRAENIRRSAEVAKLFAESGFIVVCSFITPLRAHRLLIREILSDRRAMMGVYVYASYETCEKRDPKGLYARAASGSLCSFTGKDSKFESPLDDEFDIRLNTESQKEQETGRGLIEFVSQQLERSS